MTRAEHVRWCKKRALEYLPDDPKQAVKSMLSDMNKHDETRELIRGPLGMMGLFSTETEAQARKFIEGFSE